MLPYVLQQLLEVSANRFPGQTAVISKGSEITYGGLEAVSSQLAHVLLKSGISRGDPVGIYLKKSIESVIAIFGILKAGGVYVPLDPSAPTERIDFIIRNCGIKALVTDEKQLILWQKNSLSDLSCLKCLILTNKTPIDSLKQISTAPTLNWQDVLATKPVSASPDLIENDLAYILYTSGSTGTPKGVAISHRASLTFVNWACECFQVQPSDRVSSHAPFHFDLSIFDIFATIKAGGTIILVPPELSVFPINLAKFIEEKEITIWYSVPSILTQLVLRGKLTEHQFPDLRTILFAGEVFPIKYLGQLMELLPQAKYYNLYGPTETNVCTYYEVESLSGDRVEPLPIGRACANTEVFAVKEDNTLAQPGEVGELYVRSPSLMAGYWGSPEKTEQVLVSYPLYPHLAPTTAYRTGDLVRQDSEGNYLYLGRRDNQIKSRGYRIELGEIETTLYSHPAIEEAAVIAIPDEEIGNKIKALVVKREGEELLSGDLASFCAKRLPKYMLPTLIEFRQILPKTSTGKINKTLLRQEVLPENV
ncbi:amino acid adenylation domain-containing protein [Crocosphaera sp. UHCC 0190]|uniref:amino acid adenylation domain-containing protein n=1 Tax=Crocosphaera sp. UHCC 0190 TaxID=3110246 RepID=UPI002B216A6D|nr:amino acid adenylation domain-containing protein [Crocosphaera sp. UHCC 0190]MEA5510553.1 amino acid adenylation domain-containing protein [Crocosphaera sp. UHCC 0190]